MTINFTIIHNGKPVANANEAVNVRNWKQAQDVAKYCKNMFEREYKKVDECVPTVVHEEGVDMNRLRGFTFELV